MIGFKILTILALTFSLKTVLADDIFSDEDKKDVKIVVCGGCKDKAILEKLGHFYSCVKEKFPDDYKKGEKIFKGHKDDPDGCWTDMSKLLEEFKKANENNFKEMIKCFESHIPDKKVLETCHTS